MEEGIIGAVKKIRKNEEDETGVRDGGQKDDKQDSGRSVKNDDDVGE